MIRFFVRRPVAVAMAYLAVASLGLFAWRNIPIELFPDTDLPSLQITGSWPGASPETVEAFLTSPLEATVQLIQGVEKVTSRSRQGTAFISVEFARDTDMDFARLDLSERIATLEERDLPPGVLAVNVQPYVPREFADQQGRPLLEYTFTGARTLEGLRDHLNDVVIPELSQIEGVALAEARGGRDRLLEIELDRELMNAMGVEPADVAIRVGELDLVREAGAVREGERQWTLTIRNRPGSAFDVERTIVKDDGGRIVRLSDVGVVRDTYEDVRGYYRVNYRPAVGLRIIKEIGSNAVRVADRVKERMRDIGARNPPNTRFILDRDESREIRATFSDLRSRAAVSVFVVLGVLLLFLRSIRSAVVVGASIAFSILISLNLIFFSAYSLNILTLMGLALAFGLIVDNSIVVLENIYRRWQQGDARTVSVTKGASDVLLPVVAATATTLIVFAPFVYLKGDLRVYYLPLGVVVALTLVASLLVAFTFIPALVSKVLPDRDSGDGPAARSEAGAPAYLRFYRGLLRLTLRWPWMVAALGLSALGGSTYLFQNYVNRGMFFGGFRVPEDRIDITIRFPQGTDIERTNELTNYFEERLRQMPEVEKFVTNVSSENSRIVVTFPDELQSTNIPVSIKDQLFAYSLGFSGVDVHVRGFGPSFYGGGSSPPNYSIQVLGYNYEKVREIAENLAGRLERFPRVRDVNPNASGFFSRDRASEFVVDIRRDIVARQGLTVQQLVNDIGRTVAGQVSRNQLKIGGDELRYEVKLEGNRGIDLHELRQTLLLTPEGDPVRLGELVTIESREVLAEILREDQQYERTVAYEFRGPYKLGDVYHNTIIDGTEVPPGYTVQKSDRWGRWGVEEQSQLAMVLVLALILVYMVTAALFESLRQPLCVLLTVPMALIGVFLLFFFLDANFTGEGWAGVIMMCGIVVNNAILLVDNINRHRRESSLPLMDAIVKGTEERVRPVLMTTTTTILALLPLVLFSAHADANVWNAVTYSLIGGLASSTFLVLTATPALYYLFESAKARETLSGHFSASGEASTVHWFTHMVLYGVVLVGFVFGAIGLWDFVSGLRGDVAVVDFLFDTVEGIPEQLQTVLIWAGVAWAGMVVAWPFLAVTAKWARNVRPARSP